jgi:hypothetical protein
MDGFCFLSSIGSLLRDSRTFLSITHHVTVAFGVQAGPGCLRDQFQDGNGASAAAGIRKSAPILQLALAQ